MNVGILTGGAFSAFQTVNWRSRLVILTNGALTPFVVIWEAVIFGISDNNIEKVVDISKTIEFRNIKSIDKTDKNVSNIIDKNIGDVIG